MLNAILVIVGAVAAWLVFDRVLSGRASRDSESRSPWTAPGHDRTFHSTGWEETLPPPEAAEPIIRRRDMRDRTAR